MLLQQSAMQQRADSAPHTLSASSITKGECLRSFHSPRPPHQPEQSAGSLGTGTLTPGWLSCAVGVRNYWIRLSLNVSPSSILAPLSPRGGRLTLYYRDGPETRSQGHTHRGSPTRLTTSVPCLLASGSGLNPLPRGAASGTNMSIRTSKQMRREGYHAGGAHVHPCR